MLTLIWFFNPIDVAARGIIGVLGLIDGVVYRLVSALFQLFFSLAEVQLLDNSVYEAIASRVYLFIGVIALFGVSISLLKALVNPDDVSKGVIKSFKSLVTSVVLVILMPTIFQYAYSLQRAVISDDIIGKIFQIDLGKNTGKNSMFKMCSFENKEEIVQVLDSNGNTVSGEKEISKKQCQANYITMNILEAFVTPVNYEVANNNGTTWEEARRYMIYTGNFDYIATYVDQMYDADPDESISYTFLISTIAGGVLIYIVLSFCIDLGVRAAKLAFYQLISPIPVLMKMIPGKEGQFDKWVKSTVSTFLEVFVRLIIINFVIFMAGNLFEILDSLEGFKEVNLLGKAILALGLFLFAKQAPKLLSDALGFEAGNLKLGIKGKLADGGAFAVGAGVGAGATAMTRNLYNSVQHGVNSFSNADGVGNKAKALGGSIINGTISTTAGGISGFARGVYAGKDAKTYEDVEKAATKAAAAAVEKRNEREAYKASHGGTIHGSMLGHLADAAIGVQNWATGTSAGILGKVSFEEQFKNSYNDFQAIYENASYKAMDSQLQQYKALKASGIQNYQGKNVNDAIKELEGNMLKSRIDAIRKNSQSAAYSIYNISKIAKTNPALSAKIDIDVSMADDLQLKGNKIYDKSTGNEITAEKLFGIIEGTSLSSVTYNSTTSNYEDVNGLQIDFKSIAENQNQDGMRHQKKKASDALTSDKLSVEYKEAIKLQESKK